MFNLHGQLSTWWQNALNGAILLVLIVAQAALVRAREQRDRAARAAPTTDTTPSF